MAAAIGVTLSKGPITVSGANTAEALPLATVQQRTQACQANERLPQDTSAIRLRIFAYLGPRVTVEVLAHGHVITRGERGSGWTGGVVTVPVRPISTTRAGLTICFELFLNGDETAYLSGQPATQTRAASGKLEVMPGRVRVEYLRSGRSSWWSLAPAVARRMGLGHAGAGTWSVFLVIGLMGGVVLVCSRLGLQELR